MLKNGMDGKFLDFPLCCLAYIEGNQNKLKEIAFYCVVTKALELEYNYKIIGRIKATDFSYMTAKDFDVTQKLHLSIALVSKDLGIKIESIEEATNCWIAVKEYIRDHETKYGIDAYCSMGRKLTYEAIEGKLPLRIYLVLAAIHSILGKSKPYLRITYERIAVRMTGCKSKDVLKEEKPQTRIISDRQVGLTVAKLREKNLIRIFVYNRRERFYSTKIKHEDTLRDLVAKSKFQKAEKKYCVEDRRMSQMINSQIKRIKSTGKPNTMFLNTDPEM